MCIKTPLELYEYPFSFLSANSLQECNVSSAATADLRLSTLLESDNIGLDMSKVGIGSSPTEQSTSVG